MSNFHTVLVATDFSEHSARAEIRTAMLCAELQCGTVELLTVKESGLIGMLAQIMNSDTESAKTVIAERAMRELDSLASDIEDSHGIQCTPAVRFGRPAAEIVDRAVEITADLTVVGAHGGNFFADYFLGNTADKLTRLCRRSLLVVRNEPVQQYRQVLIPVDFSEDSEHAARLALDVAPTADITVLHACDVGFDGFMQYAHVSRELINAYRIKAREEVRQKLNRFIENLGAADRHLDRVIAFGLPATVIREYAQSMRPDLIVMGKHGGARVEEMILGSVTRDTIDQTDRDILIVPSKAPASAA